jgi:hypothetical protein
MVLVFWFPTIVKHLCTSWLTPIGDEVHLWTAEEDLTIIITITIIPNIVISPQQQGQETILLLQRMNSKSVLLLPRRMDFTLHMCLLQQDGASPGVEEGDSFLDSVDEEVLYLGSKEAEVFTIMG